MMLKVGSCFSGVGFWEMGLKQLGIPHTNEFCVEFDKYPYASYKAIHGDVKNYGDATKIKGDEVEDIDLFVYSPPCQAFSVAGNQKGVDDHRGVLFFDALRIIQSKQPKICIMENVKGLTNKKFDETFKSMLLCLTMAGYTNYWKVLNTKDYGIPQNRERIFIVSVRNDIDNSFEWPIPFDNGIRLKHMLEDEVDKKYYISGEKCAKLISQIKDGKQESFPPFDGEPMITKALSSREHRTEGWRSDVSTCICARDFKDPKVVCVPCLTPDRLEKRQNGRRFKENDDPMFTLSVVDRHGVLVKEATKKGYAFATEGDSINLDQPNSLTRRGRVGVGVAQTLTTRYNQAVVEPLIIDNTQGFDGVRIYEDCPTIRSQRSGLMVTEPTIIDDQGRTTKELTPKNYCPTLRAQDHGNPPKVIEPNELNCIGMLDMKGNESIRRVYNADGLSPTLSTMQGGHREPKTVDGLRIRKLTPKEAWRLQGATDEDFEKAAKVNSNSQLYKQAGNGVSVNVVVELLKQLQIKNYI